MSAVVETNSESAAPEQTQQGQSLWADASRRFFANKAAMAGLAVLSLITLFAIFGPMIGDSTMEATDFERLESAPSIASGHLFGTDTLGRDMFQRTAYGARISLLIGVLTTLVALVIGVTYGAIAGYVGGRTDTVMMRFVDVLYSLPLVFFIIILAAIFERSLVIIFVAIGAIEWLTMSRIVRGLTMSIKEREFVQAARAMGVSTPTIIRRHIIPNVLGPVIVFVTLLIPANILIESFMSFLGLGVQEPLTSWGVLIKQGSAEMETAPWLLAFPAIFLAATMLSFNYIGDGLRDALDPKER